MASLSSIIDHQRQPFILLQSSAAQSSLPIFRRLLSPKKDITIDLQRTILISLLYPSKTLLKQDDQAQNACQILDWTSRVPGYDDAGRYSEEILDIINNTPPGPLTVAIDSVNTLCTDVGSPAEAFRLLSRIQQSLNARHSPSRLMVHLVQPCELQPLLTQITFGVPLVHLISFPPALLSHLAKEYLTAPPPASSPAKFWSAFGPISERIGEVDRIVFGQDGLGSGDAENIVVEVVIRETGRKRNVERTLEGWSILSGEPCALQSISSIKHIWGGPGAELVISDPTQNLSFNLNLTATQQQSRAQVPLPYAHGGTTPDEHKGSIYYDPDSADDIDDDDPDEDLDI